MLEVLVQTATRVIPERRVRAQLLEIREMLVAQVPLVLQVIPARLVLEQLRAVRVTPVLQVTPVVQPPRLRFQMLQQINLTALRCPMQSVRALKTVH